MREATFATHVERNSFKLLLTPRVESHLLKRVQRGKHLRSDLVAMCESERLYMGRRILGGDTWLYPNSSRPYIHFYL